jgi:hypothetical protein
MLSANRFKSKRSRIEYPNPCRYRLDRTAVVVTVLRSHLSRPGVSTHERRMAADNLHPLFG